MADALEFSFRDCLALSKGHVGLPGEAVRLDDPAAFLEAIDERRSAPNPRSA
jgi:hypothetical protein